jgi:hypothetical protein
MIALDQGTLLIQRHAVLILPTAEYNLGKFHLGK